MKPYFFLVPFLFLVHKTTAEDLIYRLNDEDFYRMPSKYHLDRFEQCIGLPNGTYCTVWADLVEDQPSELMHMIQAYSAHYTKHYNYSTIKYGLCLTKTCKEFYSGDRSHQALWTTSEACLNYSLAEEYGLKARVTDIDCFHHGQKKFERNSWDYAILAVIGAILALNVVGTLYDALRDASKRANPFLISFSIRANCARLFAPLSDHPDEARLRSMNGLRAITSLVVVVGHIPFVTINAAVNPKAFEDMFREVMVGFLNQGHMIVLTFFSLSGFLLVSNRESSDSRKSDWTELPRGVLMRWLRLSSGNLFILMLTAVWYTFTPIGPLSKEFVVTESLDCRNHWVHNVFLVTNWINHSLCNLQVWFVSSDMQLHIVGLAVVLLAPKRARSLILATMFLTGIIYPIYLTYAYDLDGIYLATPTTLNTYCEANPTFHAIYKTVLPNMPSFTMGMALGYFYTDMKKKKLFDKDYRKYRPAYYATFILWLVVLYSGSVFYVDGPRAPLLLRMFAAPVIKTLFTAGVNVFFLGAICKVDDLFRGILEWPRWAPLTRVSYCSFLVHMVVLRYTAATRDSLFFVSSHHLTIECIGNCVLVTLAAAALHLVVEAPFSSLLNKYVAPVLQPRKKSAELPAERPEDKSKDAQKTE